MISALWPLAARAFAIHSVGSPCVQRPLRQTLGEMAAVAENEDMQWVAGMNKYSHDAGVCLLSVDGRRSVVVPKERVTRVKHDGGDCAAAMEHALDAVGASLDDVVTACANNHHFRVAPFEERAPWRTSLGIYPDSTLSPYNLLPGTPKHELSHHLAHASRPPGSPATPLGPPTSSAPAPPLPHPLPPAGLVGADSRPLRRGAHRGDGRDGRATRVDAGCGGCGRSGLLSRWDAPRGRHGLPAGPPVVCTLCQLSRGRDRLQLPRH